MTLRAALPLVLLTTLLSGCVSSGGPGPQARRDEARQAYVQLGLGYLQQGYTERAKVPLKQALDLGGNDAEVNAALALVFQRGGQGEEQAGRYKQVLHLLVTGRAISTSLAQ